MSDPYLQSLVKRLKEGSSIFERISAAEALSKIGTSEAVDHLIPLLLDPNKLIREEIENCLQKIEQRKLFASQCEDLKNPDLSICLKAVEALGELGDDLAEEPLDQLLTRRSEPQVAESVLTALKKIKEAVSISLLVKGLGDPNPGIRAKSAESLGKIGHRKSLAFLILTLKDQDASVRGQAEWALHKLGFGGEFFEDIQEEEVPDRKLVEIQEGGPAAGRRKKEDTRSLDHLKQRIHDQNPDVRKDAVRALGDMGTGAVEVLIQVLKDTNEFLREQAAGFIKNIGDPAIEYLMAALKDPSDLIREKAAEILGNLQVQEAAGLLEEALKDPAPHVRAKAAESLGSLRSKNSVEALMKALFDPDDFVRVKIIFALGMIQAPQALSAVLSVLKDSNDSLRAAAAEALGALGCMEAVEPLIQKLNDSNAIVRGYAAQSLGFLKNAQAAKDLVWLLGDCGPSVAEKAKTALEHMGPLAVEALIRGLSYENPVIRAHAAEILGKIKDRRALESLLKALHDDNETVREKAIEAAGNLEDPEVETLNHALDFGDEVMKLSAVDFLARTGTKRVILPLSKAARDSNEKIARRALEGLGAAGKSAMEALTELLNLPEYPFRAEVIESLGKIGGSKVSQFLQQNLNHPEAVVRSQSLLVLSRIGGVKSSFPLGPLLHDSDEKVRAAAAHAAGALKIQAVDSLIEALSDPHLNVLGEAVDALGILESEKAVPVLIQHLRHPEIQIRFKTVEALGRIKSRDSVASLIASLNDPEDLIAKKIVWALKNIQDPALEFLIPALSVQNEMIQAGALQALAAIRNKKAIVPVAEVLKHGTEIVRIRAAEALGCLGSGAFDALAKALKDESELVQAAAIEALGKIKDKRGVRLLSEFFEGRNEMLRVKAVEALGAINETRLNKTSKMHRCMSCGRPMIPAKTSAKENWKYWVYSGAGLCLVPFLVGLPLVLYGAFRLMKGRAYWECKHCNRRFEIQWYEKAGKD